ncbi:hypothetical protein KY362_07960 [Candidatus Woesearchaeota archaeon]|nr:hypothetical protein [Candidatus Woesearchaeota archaeon]
MTDDKGGVEMREPTRYMGSVRDLLDGCLNACMGVYEKIRGMTPSITVVPTEILHEMRINGQYAQGEFDVPLATHEYPMWPGMRRTALKATNLAGGIETKVLSSCMTRAPLLEADSPSTARELVQYVQDHPDEIKEVTESMTEFGELLDIECIVAADYYHDHPELYFLHDEMVAEHGLDLGELIAGDVYLRIKMDCKDAAGHNMTSDAAVALVDHLTSLPAFKGRLRDGTLSSNYCTDKKPALVNLIKGRGKHVVASITIPHEVMTEVYDKRTEEQRLSGEPIVERFVRQNIKKNYLGAAMADFVGGGNSHHVNITKAIYRATGQDTGNLVESSMGQTFAKVTENGDLYFEVDCPNLIMGTVGKKFRMFPDIRRHLEMMGCYGSGAVPGDNAKKLAEITGAAILVGELNVLASLLFGRHHVDSHKAGER